MATRIPGHIASWAIIATVFAGLLTRQCAGLMICCAARSFLGHAWRSAGSPHHHSASGRRSRVHRRSRPYVYQAQQFRPVTTVRTLNVGAMITLWQVEARLRTDLLSGSGSPRRAPGLRSHSWPSQRLLTRPSSIMGSGRAHPWSPPTSPLHSP